MTKDPALESRIAASFGDLGPNVRRFAVMAAGLMAFAFLLNTVKIVVEINAADFVGGAVKIDFTPFWAAAKLAVEGRATDAFDVAVMREAMQTPTAANKGDMLWLYPPGWHMAIIPLGYMPFSAAYIVYSLVTLTIYCLVMWPLAKPLPGGIGLVLAGPAVLIILTLGNISLIWTAGFVGAIAAIGQGRMALAGLVIALLTLKPQLGVLVPFALAFGGYWRTAIWAVVGTVALTLVSTLVMGIDYWAHFLWSMEFINEVMQSDLVQFNLMMTWYAFARLAGAGHEIAQPVQIAVLIACAVAISWIWSRRNVTLDLKAATLCVAIPLATPYAYHYELTLALAAAMFMARDGFGATLGERLWLLALWLGPVPGLALIGQVPPVIYAAPLLTVTLVLCLRRAAVHAARRDEIIV